MPRQRKASYGSPSVAAALIYGPPLVILLGSTAFAPFDRVPIRLSEIVEASSRTSVDDQSPAYRSGVDLIPIYATVTDSAGRLASDLRKDDFEVFDNGRARPIAVFSDEDQPLSIVVMLDRSGSMVDHSDLVTAAAAGFVRKLMPSDRARIGSFGYRILIDPADFTGVQAVLLDALFNKLQSSGPSPVWTATDQSIAALAKENGRRVVILFTDGHDEPMRGQARTDVQAVMRRAQIDEVMIYAIGLAVREEPASTNSRQTLRAPRLLAPDPNLKKLADITGGAYFQIDWSSDIDATFARIAGELRQQYWLGIAPQTVDGTVHRIDVRVRRPGAVVRARKTYVAATAK